MYTISIKKNEVKTTNSSNSTLEKFIESIITNLEKNNTKKAIEIFQCLIKLPVLRRDLGEKNIKTKVAESIINFLEKNINTLSLENVENFSSFLIDSVKNPNLPESIEQIVHLLMKNGCKAVTEQSLKLAVDYCCLMLSRFKSKLSAPLEANFTFYHATCLDNLSDFNQSKLLYEQFFDLCYSNNFSKDSYTFSLIKNGVLKYTTYTINDNSFSTLESILKKLIKKRLLEIVEFSNYAYDLISKEYENKKYINCIEFSKCLFQLGIKSTSIHSFRLAAYVRLSLFSEAIDFGHNLLSLPLAEDEEYEHPQILKDLGLAYTSLGEFPKAYECFLKAFNALPPFPNEHAHWHLAQLIACNIYSSCLSNAVNQPEVIKAQLIPILNKNSENQQLCELLEIGYDLRTKKIGSNSITVLEEIIVTDKLKSQHLFSLALLVFSQACEMYGNYEKLIEFLNKFEKKLDLSFFYKRMLLAFISIKNFKAAVQLISDTEKRHPSSTNYLFKDTRGLIVTAFLEVKEYKKAYAILDKYLTIASKIEIEDIQQLLCLFSEHLDINPILKNLKTKFGGHPHLILIESIINLDHCYNIEDNIQTIKPLFNENQLSDAELELYLFYILPKEEPKKSTIESAIGLIEYCESKNIVCTSMCFIKGACLCYLGYFERAKKAFDLALDMDPQCIKYFDWIFKKPEKPKNDIEQSTLPGNVEIETNIDVIDDFSELDQLIFDPIGFHRLMVALKNEKAKIIPSSSIEVVICEWNLGQQKILNSASEKVYPVYCNNSKSPYCFVTIDPSIVDGLDQAQLDYFLTALNKQRLVHREDGQAGLKILQGVVIELAHPGIDARLCATHEDLVYGLKPDQPPLIVLSKTGNHNFVKRLVKSNRGKFLFK